MTEISTPTVNKPKRISVIWLLPIIALALGVWIVIHARLSEGPLVTIRFENAESLTAGKTKVQYLNVTVGQVEKIALDEDNESVLVTVRMELEAKDLLREDTRFWVVRAKLQAGQVSGLGTLLGGAYLEISPGTGEPSELTYTGLESPPLTPAGAPGIRLSLYSEQASSVSMGDSVLYHGYKVGRIESMRFDPDRNQVHYDLFIDAPYHTLVNRSVRFWNISGIAFNASAEGIEVRTGSMDTVLLGGVAFDVPEEAVIGSPVEDGTEYRLYESYADIQKDPFRYSTQYVVEFTDSLRGLKRGAPVEYRGLPIGQVERILVSEMAEHGIDPNGAALAVLIKIEPARIGLADTADSLEQIKGEIATGVANGLRASLETGNLLTGSLFISFDYHEQVESAQLGRFDEYASIPTIQTGLGKIEAQVNTFLEKLNALPLEETLGSVDGLLSTLTATIESVNEIINDERSAEMTAELTGIIKDLRSTMAALSPESPAFQAFEGSMRRLNTTLQNLDDLTGTLKDQPNALVLPSRFPADPIPGAP